MSILDRFNKLIGKEPEPISDREKWRRAMVRDGNLDWQGLPIDRNAGGPINTSESRAYREAVGGFLEGFKLKVEQIKSHFPVWNPNQFDREAAVTERAYDRRFDKRQDRDVKSVNDFLRDGACAPPKKRDR
jgi:hypothetical protein